MAWFVYILRCADSTFYTGITNDVLGRLNDHNTSKRGARYTKSRRPVDLVYQERKRNKSSALKREWEIKSWSRSEKESFLLAFLQKKKKIIILTKKSRKRS